MNYILLNIVLPFICGCLLCVLVLNFVKIADVLMWFLSFGERKAYRQIMESTPILTREYNAPGNYTMYTYKFDDTDLSATIITNGDCDLIRLGIFNDEDECLYSKWYEPHEKSKKNNAEQIREREGEETVRPFD